MREDRLQFLVSSLLLVVLGERQEVLQVDPNGGSHGGGQEGVLEVDSLGPGGLVLLDAAHDRRQVGLEVFRLERGLAKREVDDAASSMSTSDPWLSFDNLFLQDRTSTSESLPTVVETATSGHMPATIEVVAVDDIDVIVVRAYHSAYNRGEK